MNALSAHGDFDDYAQEIVSVVTENGVLTRRWILLALALITLIGILVAGIANELMPKGTSYVVAIAIGVVAGVACLLLVGRFIEALLDYRYFRPVFKTWRAGFERFKSKNIEHVFCMTDLVLGLPFYISSKFKGFARRRLKAEGYRYHGVVEREFQTFACSTIPVVSVVRASAAFPGISPFKLSIPSDPVVGVVNTLPKTAFLADGGIWNNLATQTLREEQMLGEFYLVDDENVLRPWAAAPEEMPLLIVNGSAPLRPTRSWLYVLPGFAILKSIFQVMQVQNRNTVLPRMEEIQEGFDRRARGERASWFKNPANLLVNLGSTVEEGKEYMAGVWPDDWVEKRRSSASEEKMAGFTNDTDWHKLWTSETWSDLVDQYGTNPVTEATHLSRVERATALKILARAYLNTFTASLFLAPLKDEELEHLSRLESRLRLIVNHDH